MEYTRFGDAIVVRLNRGEEVIANLKKVAEQESVTLGLISGLGAVDEITLGWYDVEKQQYHSKTLHGQREVTSLNGNFSTMGGDVYLHAHVTVADQSYRALGGHLESARVSATLEAIIRIIDGEVDRFTDAETGLNLMKLSD